MMTVRQLLFASLLVVACSKKDPTLAPLASARTSAPSSPAIRPSPPKETVSLSVEQILLSRERASTMCRQLSVGRACTDAPTHSMGPFVGGKSWTVFPAQDKAFAASFAKTCCDGKPVDRCRAFARGYFTFQVVGEPSAIAHPTNEEESVIASADTFLGFSNANTTEAKRDVSTGWEPPLAMPPVVTESDLPMYASVAVPKLGVQMEVPEGLAAKRGANLISTRDGLASVTFSELSPTKGLDELFADATREDPQSPRSVTYKRKKETWFVVSGYVGTVIYYDKVARLGDRNLRFSLTFPAKQKPDYEADVGYMASSFRVLGAPAPKPPKGLCRHSGDCSPGYHCTPGGFCIIDY